VSDRDEPFRLDNPLFVQWEYASEERLAKRNAAYSRLVQGVSAEDAAYEAVAEVSPARVLEVGCGTGVFAERVVRGVGAEVVALDISARMAELTAARDIDARVGDVQSLPFDDGSFDCAVANWVLYHVPDVDLAVRELHRVLRPGGRLVAATLGVDHMGEMWRLLGGEPTAGLSFWSENGREVLLRTFPSVEQRDASATMVFPDPQSMREFVAATINRAHLAEHVPSFTEPFETHIANAIFVAEKAR
jgi:SAM-dependent methyltransferase